MRKFTGGKESMKLKGDSPIECLHALEDRFPDFKRAVNDKQGKLRPQVLFFVNGQRIHADEMNTTLKKGDEVLILYAIGGG